MKIEVPSLLLSLGNLKKSHDKSPTTQKYEMSMGKTPFTLFHILQAEMRHNKWAAARHEMDSSASVPGYCCKSSDLASKHIEEMVVPSSVARRSQPLIPVRYPKRLLVSDDIRFDWMAQEEHGLGYALPMLKSFNVTPYLLLIRTTSPTLTFSSIQEKCLNGEILCRFINNTPQYWPMSSSITLMFLEKKEYSEPAGDGRVHFKDLKNLQWKIFKGIVKRKKEMSAFSRYRTCSFGWTSTTMKRGPALIFIPLIDIEKNIADAVGASACREP
ncbi:uncharacterized protein [Ambystoma mexicanum]|uniref:uncharacterized protein isoform X2 n=1 Tax=Ambystoma mexicanum TaxID=8296 RepID=UPI0037E80B72